MLRADMVIVCWRGTERAGDSPVLETTRRTRARRWLSHARCVRTQGDVTGSWFDQMPVESIWRVSAVCLKGRDQAMCTGGWHGHAQMNTPS